MAVEIAVLINKGDLNSPGVEVPADKVPHDAVKVGVRYVDGRNVPVFVRAG
jgi:hypothetical protein